MLRDGRLGHGVQLLEYRGMPTPGRDPRGVERHAVRLETAVFDRIIGVFKTSGLYLIDHPLYLIVASLGARLFGQRIDIPACPLFGEPTRERSLMISENSVDYAEDEMTLVASLDDVASLIRRR